MSQSMAHSMKRFQGICDSLEEKAGVSASANAPSSHWGDIKLLQVEKLEDEKECKVEWLVVLGYSLPPSGIFTCLKSRHFRFTHTLSPSVSLSLSVSSMHIFPFNPHSVL